MTAKLATSRQRRLARVATAPPSGSSAARAKPLVTRMAVAPQSQRPVPSVTASGWHPHTEPDLARSLDRRSVEDVSCGSVAGESRRPPLTHPSFQRVETRRWWVDVRVLELSRVRRLKDP